MAEDHIYISGESAVAGHAQLGGRLCEHWRTKRYFSVLMTLRTPQRPFLCISGC